MRIFLTILILFIASCTSPDISRQGIRPGVTQAHDFSGEMIKNGQVSQFRVDIPGLPAAVIMASRARKIGQNRFRHEGTARMPFPNADPKLLREVAAKFFAGSDVQVAQNALVFKYSNLTDHRGRTINGNLLNIRFDYAPHDCFATIGQCTYRTVGTDGVATNIVVTTEETGGIWSTITRKVSSGKITNRSVFSVAADGMPIDLHTIEISPEGEEHEVRFTRLK